VKYRQPLTANGNFTLPERLIPAYLCTGDMQTVITKELRAWIKRRKIPDTQAMPPHTHTGKWKNKGINLFRRLTIVILTFLYRKYRHVQKPKIESVNSVLIIPHFPIGDIVLTSSLWEALKKRKSSLRIGVAISKNNKSVLDCENIDNKYDLFSPGYFRLFREMRRARNDRWDVVLAPVGFYKPTRFAFISRFIAGNGITSTMHSARSKRYARIYSFCFKRAPQWESIPMIDQYISLLELTFDIQIPSEERFPHFTTKPDIALRTKQEIEDLLAERKASKYILVNLEAKHESREWGFKNISLLQEKIINKWGDILIVLIASPHYRTYYSDNLARILNSSTVLFETETIHQVAALIENALLVITPDTAIVHITTALKKKLIAFYPAPDEWLPYGTAIVLYPTRWEPISTISVDTVFSHIISLLTS
jgi:ADP-heptose:LPS heptosyltransferase